MTLPHPKIPLKRPFFVFNLYLIFRPYFTAVAAIMAAVLLMVSRTESRSLLSVLFVADKKVFKLTRFPLPAFLATHVNFGLDGYCLANGGACYVYGGTEFNTQTGVWLPEDPRFRTIDLLYTVLGGIACLFAAFHTLTALVQFYLLKSLSLPLGFLTDRDRFIADAYLQMICIELGSTPLFWVWWAHVRGPMGPVLVWGMVAVAMATFGMTATFSRLIGGDSRMGSGAYIPIVAVILIFDPLCHAVMYLVKPHRNWTIFDHGPSLTREPSPDSPNAKSHSRSNTSSVEKGDPPTTTSEKGTSASLSAATKKVYSTPSWARRKKDKTGDLARRRSSGTSFFSPFRRPTITSVDFKEAIIMDGHLVAEPPSLPPIPTEMPLMAPMPSGPPSAPLADSLPPESGRDTWQSSTAVEPQAEITSFNPRGISSTLEPLQGRRLSTIDSQSEENSEGQLAPTDNRSMLSSNSYDNSRWIEDYKTSPALAIVMYALHSGRTQEPYVLSQDGLLYRYIPDPDGQPDREVPRLVPPEGPIRFELVEDAVDEIDLEGEFVSEPTVMHRLVQQYFWDEMLVDVKNYLGH